MDALEAAQAAKAAAIADLAKVNRARARSCSSDKGPLWSCTRIFVEHVLAFYRTTQALPQGRICLE